LGKPSQQFAVDPLATDTRPEDTIVVDQAKLDRALAQYRQEQQAALNRTTPPATYGAPGRQTVAPTPVQPTNYSVGDRVLGAQQPSIPATWRPYSAAPQQSQVSQMQQTAPYSLPGMPELQPRRSDKPFTFTLGNVQASRIEPSVYAARMPQQSQVARLSPRDLQDYAEWTGIDYGQVQPLPWGGQPQMQPLPWAPQQSIYVSAQPQTMPQRDQMQQQFMYLVR
jgi:hypothetical protein